MSAMHERFPWWGPVALALCACAPEPAPPVSAPVPVTVVTLSAQPVTLTRELPGRTSAFLVAEVRPQVGGLVKQRLFEEGAIVKAGQPLVPLFFVGVRRVFRASA